MDESSLSDLFSDDSMIPHNDNRSITSPSFTSSSETSSDGYLPMKLASHNSELINDSSMFSSSSLSSMLDFNLGCDQNDNNFYHGQVLANYANWVNEEEVYHQAWSTFIKNFSNVEKQFAHNSSASIVTGVIKKEESSENIQNIFDSISDLFEQDEEDMKPLLVNYSENCKSSVKQEMKHELPEIKFDIGPLLSSTSCDKAPFDFENYMKNLLSSDDEKAKDLNLENQVPSTTSSHNSSNRICIEKLEKMKSTSKTSTKRKAEVCVLYYFTF